MDAAALLDPPTASASLPELIEFVRLTSQRRGPGMTDELIDQFGTRPGPQLPARPLLERLAATFAGGPHQIAIDCDPALELPLRELATVGVIVCEAITNAVKHAFPAGRVGQIWVRLAPDRDRRRLTIRDSGLGIGDLAGDPVGGAALIESLAGSLGGYARLGSAPFGGGLVTVVYPPTEQSSASSTAAF